MDNSCNFEYSFRRKDMAKLLASNPKASLIIIKNEFKTVAAGRNKKVDTIVVSAYAVPAKPIKAKAAKAMGAAPEDLEIIGCPYPPGCPPENEG